MIVGGGGLGQWECGHGVIYIVGHPQTMVFQLASGME